MAIYNASISKYLKNDILKDSNDMHYMNQQQSSRQNITQEAGPEELLSTITPLPKSIPEEKPKGKKGKTSLKKNLDDVVEFVDSKNSS